MKLKHILVLGAGVSGLTTALKLLEAGHRVTIWSKESEAELPSTSRNAYAMWVPVRIDADARIERWANESFTEFEKLARFFCTGVAMRQIVSLKNERSEPWYATTIKGFRHGTGKEIPFGYEDAHILERAPVIAPVSYLRWLRSQITSLGGEIAQNSIKRLADCGAQFNVIVNATGLGARQLADDATLYPEKVQVVTVKNTGFDRVVIDDEGPNKRACIVPHTGYIKLGAVFSGNNNSLAIEHQATTDIIARCCRIAPDLKVSMSDIISVDVAFRPERPSIRVEVEKLTAHLTVIHNYGHDGMGYLVSHGIASEIAGLID